MVANTNFVHPNNNLEPEVAAVAHSPTQEARHLLTNRLKSTIQKKTKGEFYRTILQGEELVCLPGFPPKLIKSVFIRGAF